MGKKKGKEQKGKGAEKTFQKTDRKAEKKLKKELQKKGEEDIEKLIAEFQEQDRKRAEIVEEKCSPPSPRCNMSLTAHPDKEELILFGGEFFNGKQTLLYNDLFFYNIRSNDWTLVKSPDSPPPRCAHQAVAVSQSGGQLWIFGGEFASPSQSQFYHYKDLWMLSLKEKTWQKINSTGGPSARSGHRMCVCKKLLLVFGGFHDNIRDYKYYNDLFAFNLETYNWMKLEVSGIPPHPRSGCILAVSLDQNHVVIYGGYSKEKIKRDVDKGKTHTDMFTLSVDSRCKQETTPVKWKWVATKQSGFRPSPRCGCSIATIPGNRAVVFGGVFDEVEDEEEVEGVFHNDMYSLDVDKAKWHEVILKGKRDLTTKKKRRKKKQSPDGSGDQVEEGAKEAGEEDGEDEEDDVEDDEEDMEDELEDLTVEDHSEKMEIENETTSAVDSEQSNEPIQHEDIFTVSVAGPTTSQNNSSSQGEQCLHQEAFIPGKRMNTMLAVKHGILYMYGGVYEVGDKQYTLSDMYSLDLHKLDEWSTIIACDLDLQDWEDSESSGEEEVGEDMDSEDTDDDEDMDEDAPDIEADETLDVYYERTAEHWLSEAKQVADDEHMQVSDKQLKKAASRMAKEYYKEQQST